MTMRRVFEIPVIASLCLTVAYLASAFTGLTTFEWHTVLTLASPLMVFAGYTAVLVISGVVFLYFLPSDYVSVSPRAPKTGLLRRFGGWIFEALVAGVMLISALFSWLVYGPRQGREDKDVF